MQTTIEKEPDFIRVVETDGGKKFILQLEFQSVDGEGMIYRMQEYYGLLRRKYGLPVKQFVVYLGRKPSRMQTRLAPDEVFEGFTLTSLREYSHERLLASDVPEEIILAIRSDFGGKKPAEVLKEILGRLQALGGEEIALRKYIRQLPVLARLRNLVKETQRQVTGVGLLCDITKDCLCQKGLAKGREQVKRELIESTLAAGVLGTEQLARYLEVTTAHVEAIAHESEK